MSNDILKPKISNPKVILRKPKQGDLERRLSYGQHSEIVRMFGGNSKDMPPLTVEEASAWLKAIEDTPYAWVVEHDGHLLGEAKLHSLNEHDRRARFALGFYDHAKLGIGLGQEVTHLVLRYAFEELKLHRVDLRVLAYNVRAIRCYEKCGFVIEGKERETAYVDGEWHDDLIMGILANDFAKVV